MYNKNLSFTVSVLIRTAVSSFYFSWRRLLFPFLHHHAFDCAVKQAWPFRKGDDSVEKVN